MKKLSEANQEDIKALSEAEKSAQWKDQYAEYQKQGAQFSGFLNLVQGRLNQINTGITVIKTSTGKPKRPETFGTKNESLAPTLSAEQKDEIEALVVREEQEKLFSLYDVMNILDVLLKYKREAMDTKIENNELKIQLRNYKPETSPRANESKTVLNDEDEAEKNFQDLENEPSQQEEEE